MYVILGLFAIAFGLFALIYPEAIYELKEMLRSSISGEPSKFYIIMTRIGGVITILVGIGCFAAFFMK